MTSNLGGRHWPERTLIGQLQIPASTTKLSPGEHAPSPCAHSAFKTITRPPIAPITRTGLTWAGSPTRQHGHLTSHPPFRSRPGHWPKLTRSAAALTTAGASTQSASTAMLACLQHMPGCAHANRLLCPCSGPRYREKPLPATSSNKWHDKPAGSTLLTHLLQYSSR